MESVLVIRRTFYEIPTAFEAGRKARSYSDFDIGYGGRADLPEESAKFDDACRKATSETCSSAGDSSTDLSENWADVDTDTESDESETCCATPPPEQQLVQQVMMPMPFLLVPLAQTNMVWGCQAVPQAPVMSDNAVRSHIAPPPGSHIVPPPGNFSLNQFKVEKKPERTTVVLRNLPSCLSRCDLLQILDDAGFSERYDFVYLPTNFRNMTVLGTPL
jgi:hypothetical protein